MTEDRIKNRLMKIGRRNQLMLGLKQLVPTVTEYFKICDRDFEPNNGGMLLDNAGYTTMARELIPIQNTITKIIQKDYPDYIAHNITYDTSRFEGHYILTFGRAAIQKAEQRYGGDIDKLNKEIAGSL